MNSYKSYSDIELTSFLKSGDELAFIEIYNRFWPVLYLHSRKMLRDDDQAKDIVQDIFTNLWNKCEDIQINSSIKNYLYSSVRNHTLNYINRGKLKDKYLDSLVDFVHKGEFQTEEQVIVRDLSERIEREVADFSPKMKTIYELSRKKGLSNLEIAFELNITDHAVKKTINRALKRLKRQISIFIFF